MNIIRTAAVELSAIPAIAYKLKLASGGAGLKILRLDADATAMFTLDKRGGAPAPFGKVDDALFPSDAVDEALDLTEGLPYSSRGKIKVSVYEQVREAEDVTETEVDAIDLVDSDEYAAIVSRYTDEKGKINYRLMNKDFIQFAAKSKTVADAVAENALEDDILVYIVKNRAAYLADKKDTLTDDQTRALIETLDEIDPRGAFKELKAHLRRLLARK
ncbi:MAG: hypothetical protein LBN02_03315 [Oscillospiraceae bacterium]|jgi:hypothetical protein|nr:hypothetical protein [Oscillospiraceae bacterium]